MTTFEFVNELPPKTLMRDPFHSAAVMEEFATALRLLPGQWAKWPLPMTPGMASSYTTQVRRGRLAAFRGCRFDATTRNGTFYVRYLGEGER